MVFASREAAGQMLGRSLKEQGIQADFVLGLPRGGVVVAAEVAHLLQAPLDVLIVRKIGHPWHREFALGAMAEGGVVVLDNALISRNPLLEMELQHIIDEEKQRLHAYQESFRHSPLELNAKNVLVVDDGLATGATTEAGVLAAKQQNAARVVVAAPVASTNAVERLEKVADEVLCLVIDPEFD